MIAALILLQQAPISALTPTCVQDRPDSVNELEWLRCLSRRRLPIPKSISQHVSPNAALREAQDDGFVVREEKPGVHTFHGVDIADNSDRRCGLNISSGHSCGRPRFEHRLARPATVPTYWVPVYRNRLLNSREGPVDERHVTEGRTPLAKRQCSSGAVGLP